MTEEYKIDIEWLGGGGYFCVMTAILMLGSMQANWMDKSDLHMLSFRPPWAFRLGIGMVSMFMLACALYFAFAAVHYFGVWQTWLWNVPLSLLIAVLFAYFGAPMDTSIDLDKRVCYRTAGWRFHSRHDIYPLTEELSVCICSGGQTYYVFLVIGGGIGKRLILARPERKSDALDIAQEIAEKLKLPIKEATLSTLRNLG